MSGSAARAIFLGSKLRIAATVIGLVVVLIGAGVFTGVLGAPAVQEVQNRFGTVNDTTTTIETDITVTNPNPIGVSLGGLTVDYDVSMNEVAMANGTKRGISLARGESTISLTTLMYNERIPQWWVSHITNGEQTTLAVAADVTTPLVGLSFGVPEFTREITTDISSSLNSSETRELNANLGIVSDPLLYLNETSGHFGEVTAGETPIVMTFTVYNPKSYAIPLGELGYSITMNGIQVGSGESSRSLAVPPKSTETITATTVIDNSRLDEWWVSHLERNQVTDLTIDFYARVDLSSLGGDPVEIPLDSVTHVMETDFFGNKQQVSASPDADESSEDGTPDGDDSDDSTPDDGDAAGETETPSPSPTPTNDGGLL